MLVYGDPQYPERLSCLVSRLRARMAQAQFYNLEGLRALLIQAGQLEQALADGPCGSSAAASQASASASRCTEAVAEVFWRAFHRPPGPAGPFPQDSAIVLATAARELARIPCSTWDPTLTVKIPEGFEFYALFPEQYGTAALAWAAHHTRVGAPGRVLVAGIRSIGTSLSALVKAALDGGGWNARRLTLRPQGHPFDRRAVLPEGCGALLDGCRHGLVVDEGPGLSGSSVAAAAEALAARGVHSIAFLPGHAGEPGHAAGPAVRKWWRAAPRFITPLSDLRWDGNSLAHTLTLRTASLNGADATDCASEDLSAGAWRSRCFPSETDWPPVAEVFERVKYLCRSGRGRPVLWKFCGLGCAQKNGDTASELAAERMRRLAACGWTAAPLDEWAGFMAFPWMQGRRLNREAGRSATVQSVLGRYIACAVGPPLARDECQASVDRMAQMLFHNTSESLGPDWAERTRMACKLVGAAVEEPSYGDGRMAPSEWLEADDQRFLKTDCAGHDSDHTLVGRQSWLWDLAGTLVEWDLADQKAAAPLLSTLESSGFGVPAERLAFFLAAYAAFRLGFCALAAPRAGADSPERTRLEHAQDFYRERLRQVLSAL